MARPRVLTMILAGGKGSRLDVLTRERPKPVLPFAGTHRLIDIPLSNVRNSGLDDVLLCVQYHATQMDQAVAGGRPWDLDRTRGGLRIVGPEEGRGAERSGFSTGNADLLRRLRHEIRAYDPDALLVLSADHVYRLDYSEVVATHLDAGAACTIVTHDLSKEEAGNHATVQAASSEPGAAVTGFAYKPDSPATSVVATEVFVYDPGVLMRTLGLLHRRDGSEAEGGDTGLGDFGEKLLPHLVEHESVVAHPLTGYWRDVGRPESYLRAHRDLLGGRVDLFDDPQRPVLGLRAARPPAHVRAGAQVVDSMLSPGCDVAGTVERSVLGPGVRVAAGARVVDSVVFDDVVIDEGAFVGTAIVDERACFGRGARLGAESGTRLPGPADIGLVGRDSVVGARVELPTGSRLEPGTTA